MINKVKQLDLKSLLIIGLIIAIVLMRACNGDSNTDKPETVDVGGKTYEVVDRKVDTVFVPKDTIVYKPGKTIYKEKTIYLPISPNVDSLSIIKNYYSANVYRDTLHLSENMGYVNVTDTISQNKIKGRVWEANIKQKTIHETTIVKELARTQVYIGGTVGFDTTNPVNFVGPTIMLKTKSDKVYTLSGGYGIDRRTVIQGGLLWKVKLHK
jgi:hypothetical protein